MKIKNKWYRNTRGMIALVIATVFILQFFWLAKTTTALAASTDRSSDVEETADFLRESIKIIREHDEFKDGYFWMTTVQDVTDSESDDSYDLDNILQSSSNSCTLQAGHIYTVRLSFLCGIDADSPEKQQVRLQARFPDILEAGEVDAISSAIFGEHISSAIDFFGISAKESVRLYYVQDSMSARTLKSGGSKLEAPKEAVEALLASADGFSLYNAFARTIELDEFEITTFDVSYRIAVEFLPDQVDIAKSRSNDFWWGQKLMGEEITPAPARELAVITAKHQVVSDPLCESEAADHSLWIFLGVVLILMAIAVAGIWHRCHVESKKILQSEERGQEYE